MQKLKVQVIERLNLKDLKPSDIGDDQPLFVEGIGLDSIDALELIVFLQQEYNIKLSNADDGPRVFHSIRTMADYITANSGAVKVSYMNVPSFVAGMGIVSAIGSDVQSNLDSLCEEKTGIGTMQWLSTARHQALPVGEVKLSNTELAAITGLSARLPRTALLSCMAAKETLTSAGWKNDNALRTGFISANTVGGMDKTENFYKLFSKNPAAGKLADVVHHECGSVTELVADFLGIQHFVSTVSTACSSSANSIFMGARMIGAGLLDCALVGGADALTRFTLNGFNTLMILDKELCKPFDENRRGFNLGEGAAYLLLLF